MRSLSVIALIALLATAASHARTIVIIKERGGIFGYLYVNERHIGEKGQDYHELKCTEPGFTACRWTHPPTIVRGFPRLIEYAEERIAAGELTGSYSETIDGVVCTVRWEAQDTRNATITLED